MPDSPKIRILIVDDDKFILNLLCQMLTILGYEITAVRDGLEALKAVKTEKNFRLVMTDIHMPMMDGWQLAVRIKGIRPEIPIIAISGDSPDNILPRLSSSAIDHALFKPFRVDLLKNAMEKYLKV